MELFTVYTINDKATGKVLYVGETNCFNRRKNEHLSLSASTKEWLSEYGVDNVNIEPYKEFNTELEAVQFEEELINKFDTINNGYNKNHSGNISLNKKEYFHNLNQMEKRKAYTLDKVKAYYATEEGRKNKAEYYKWRYNNDPEFRAKEQERRRLYREKKKGAII